MKTEMTSPSFTLVTVTYNAEHTLQRTLDSVAAQCYQNIEHLLIDGKSTDRTSYMLIDYCEQQRKKGRKVTLISEPDNGLYDAMNKAFSKATGDYICFLNAGDKLHATDTLDKIAHIAINQPQLPAVLYGDTAIVNHQGEFLYRRRLTPPQQLTWRSFRQGMRVCHQSFYAHRSLWLPYDMYYRFSADFDWCIRIMKRAAEQNSTLVHTHLTLTDYLHEGMTTQNHQASLIERYKIMVVHYGCILTLMRHVSFIFRSLFKGSK